MDNKTVGSDESVHPSVEDVRRTVDAIAASGVLGKSKRRERLLRYLLDQELDGLGAQIKAYTIATDVLGRDASFEPSTDSIVRSEVGRLRDALNLFFAERRDEALVRIEIPKGTYRPKLDATALNGPAGHTRNTLRPIAFSLVFVVSVAGLLLAIIGWQVREKPSAISISELPFEVVRVSVEPFKALGTHRAVDGLAFGMYSELVMDLSAYPWISVISPQAGTGHAETTLTDYVLTGSIHWNQSTLTTHAELVALTDRSVIWSDRISVEVTSETVNQSVIEVSSQIANVLGSVHGIAPQLAKARSAQVSEPGLDALLCYLDLHAYLARPTDQRHLDLRGCLGETLTRYPDYGDAWAALAIVYMDESRFERNPRDIGMPWQDATRAIEQALVYAPTRMTSLNAAIVHSIEGPEKDAEAFERYSNLLLQLFPRHPPTLFNVGSRMAEFGGDWDNGLELVNQALALEPNPPSFFHITQAYNAALLGSDKEAWFSVQELTTETSKSELLLRYLAASRNEFQDEQRAMLLLLGEQGLVEKDDMEKHILGRRYNAELEAALLEQLDTAFPKEGHEQ
ncbi:hypothetical protein [uncultured Tateyamaria sp.]|uniref:tetratricopeptide repeat protein n=1 Tax=uncultured Tateyamaria sp. TaxID=455651 RepID=UPI002603F02E|nr:hypothetical protein [uncultured Tateyamaria sp.]